MNLPDLSKFKVTKYEETERRRDLVNQIRLLLDRSYKQMFKLTHHMPISWLEDFHQTALRQDTEIGKRLKLWNLIKDAQPR